MKRHFRDRRGADSLLVSLAAVFSIVTQRSSLPLWGGALRDDTKNGCEGD